MAGRSIYPDRVSTALPTGWRAKVEALAAADHRTVGAYLRELIRKHLEASARAERRRKAKRAAK